MRLVLIRHLPTIWNIEGRLQGKADIPIQQLTKETQMQIDLNSERLKSFDFESVLTSSLIRTKQTAECYGFVKTTVEPLIDEFDFGRFEGISKPQMLSEIGYQWNNQFLEVDLGESTTDLKARCEMFFEKYKSKKDVLVFGHGVIIRSLVSLAHLEDFNLVNQRHVNNNEIVFLEI